jgi:hypothetical protein
VTLASVSLSGQAPIVRGGGAETIREFCGRLRQGREHAILQTAAAWEPDGLAHGERRPLSGAAAATFVQRLMVVDLASGSLVVEEAAQDRTAATWHGVVKTRLETLGVGVLSLLSDRAKALIKLAETGLECLSIPEVFYLIPDLGTSSSLTLFNRLRHAQQAVQQARERLAACQASHPDKARKYLAGVSAPVDVWWHVVGGTMGSNT